MHYYGTYAIALAAGIPNNDARKLAYASQYVDDSAAVEDSKHKDGGLLVTFSTAHHLIQSARTMVKNDQDSQRKIWVPNHFIPGGVGETFEERAICAKDSKIARTMFAEHIQMALARDYGLELLGIATHAYMDTFSHYGFSGFSSKYNKIVPASINSSGITDDKFLRKHKTKIYKIREERIESTFKANVVSFFTGTQDSALGHGAVMSFPDMPYLNWEFEFPIARPGEGTMSTRSNRMTFMQAAKRVHENLSKFAQERYQAPEIKEFKEIRRTIARVLATEGDEKIRSNAWLQSGLLPEGAKIYDKNEWDSHKITFSSLNDSRQGIGLSCYRFHQAATYHRYYMLKDLLPRFGLAVY